MTSMSAKQIRYFGTPAQKAALRRKRAGSQSRASRPTTTRRQPRMTKKKSAPRRGNMSIVDMAVNVNAFAQVAEPVASRAPAIITAAKAKDFKAAASELKAAAKETISFENIGQAAGPAIAVGLGKKVASMLRIKAPKLGRGRSARRLW